MKIYSAEQIRAWDAFTIQNEPVRSIDLMERAAQACLDWIVNRGFAEQHFTIFCGKGNNGGDGLAIARLLWKKGATVDVYVLEFGKKGTEDFQTNLQRLHELPITIHFVQSAEHFPDLDQTDIVIDALFGSGLNKPLDGLSADLVLHINKSSSTTLSIDLPSGLFADKSSRNCVVIEADFTLSFQVYKMAFLVAENAPFIGEIQILDIGLHQAFSEHTHSNRILVDRKTIRNLFKPRNRFAHKGNFGHALLIGGSYGKIGAIQLCAKACLRSGAGLVSTYTPKCGYAILQTAVPEAMAITNEDELIITHPPSDADKFTVLGIGPGMETAEATRRMLLELLAACQKPVVVDADGLNCLAQTEAGLTKLPPYSVLTPHPKEFERLFGSCDNDFERIELAARKAKELSVAVVLKGHHTLTALPDGRLYFNATGNAGMAKGGSGDVLTGIITAFCAQGYDPADAAVLGVYVHGLAGDLAAAALSQEAMIASDIITFLSQAFVELRK